MTTGMQEKFFRELQNRLVPHKVELLVNYEWANRGQGFIQHLSSFNSLASFIFDFQVGNASFKLSARNLTQPIEYYVNFNSTPGQLLEVIESIIGAALQGEVRQYDLQDR